MDGGMLTNMALSLCSRDDMSMVREVDRVGVMSTAREVGSSGPGMGTTLMAREVYLPA